MGQFYKSVRRNKIAAPNQRGFSRAIWQSQLDEATADDDDKRLFYAGLFFDDLLTFLRKEKRISDISLTPDAIIRLAIAITTSNLFCIHEEASISRTKGDTPPTLIMSQTMERTIKLQTGQQFTPDELLTGAGDGLKHMLRELLTTKASPNSLTEYQADVNSVDLVNLEFNKAILYQCAVEYWNDCVGNGYGLVKGDQGISLVPFNEALEIARTVSTYRRLNIALQDTMFIVEQWLHKWPSKMKERMCGIPMVSRVSGRDRIEHIELALNNRTLLAASSAVAAKLWLRHSYYKFLLDEPLPNLSGFSLNQIILGWQLLQSLSVVIFDSLNPINNGDVKHLLSFAPRISKHALCATFAKALSLDRERANQLVRTFVFDPTCSQEVWFQPLVPLQDDYCLVIPCIHSVQLQRIVEGWMRQGGLDLDRRGPEFEKFCRDDLASSLEDSPIKDSVVLLDRAVRFTPPMEREEEIDIVVVVSDTILLIEAKCILWPDDSLQFANYRDTVEKAVVQIVRKRDAVRRNYDAFSERLKQLGCNAPPKCSVIACVLTNSAVYSGFPIDGIPIVDLSILGKFFKNEHVKIEARQAGKTVRRHAITFYANADEAGRVLNEYLLSPPQLSDSRNSVKKRELVFPVESSDFGKLTQKLYSVEIDINEMEQRYGVQAI
jgi:hypothetical protein